ncbi:hypothetical protein J6590_080061 [Homalodisca vitripennis]|nr:hypothetical protein J6590_080061 [Homalodisca vitripennis]
MGALPRSVCETSCTYGTLPLYGLYEKANTPSTNSLTSMAENITNSSVFTGKEDRYKGIHVKSKNNICSTSNFITKLEASLQEWTSQKKSAAWFYISLGQSEWVPLLTKGSSCEAIVKLLFSRPDGWVDSEQNGFRFHLAARDGSEVAMVRWLAAGDSCEAIVKLLFSRPDGWVDSEQNGFRFHLAARDGSEVAMVRWLAAGDSCEAIVKLLFSRPDGWVDSEQNGFRFHHAARDGSEVAMVRWLAAGESHIPVFSHTMIGVGAVVVNTENKLLVVQERYQNQPYWKLPGGYVEPGESVVLLFLPKMEISTLKMPILLI